MLLVLRYDDYSSISPTQLETQILTLHRQHGLPVTFGVIPCVHGVDPDSGEVGEIPLSAEKVSILRGYIEAGVLTPAMHGYSHQSLAVSEFEGVDAGVQFTRLDEGKRLLDAELSQQVTAFIPPWNSYDHNTLQSLESLGFTCISADSNGCFDESSTLVYLPTTKQELTELRKSVLLARLVPDAEPIVVLVFHEYDFACDGSSPARFTVEEYSALLGWVATQQDVRVLSVSEAVSEASDLSPERLAANAACQKQLRAVPPFLYPRAVYLSRDAARVVARVSQAAAVLFYLLILVSSALASSWFCGFADAQWSPVAGVIAGTLGLMCSIKCRRSGWRALLVTAMGLGLLAGCLNIL